MKTMTLPKISPKQHQILDLLYRHRFLTRRQLQAFLNHKDKKTIYLWLKDLRTKGYIDWIYHKASFVDKSTPAIYYLSTRGVNHFRELDFHAEIELHKRYKDNGRSQAFIDRCLTIADACLTLHQAGSESTLPTITYFYETEADYLSDSYYHFLAESELIRPNLCFSKLVYNGGGDEPRAINSYLLEVFDTTLPRYRLRHRLQQYVTYCDEALDEWEAGTNGDPSPTILLVCATLPDLIYAKRRTKGLIAAIWEREDDGRPAIRFTTTDKLKAQGILGEIWEAA